MPPSTREAGGPANVNIHLQLYRSGVELIPCAPQLLFPAVTVDSCCVCGVLCIGVLRPADMESRWERGLGPRCEIAVCVWSASESGRRVPHSLLSALSSFSHIHIHTHTSHLLTVSACYCVRALNACTPLYAPAAPFPRKCGADLVIAPDGPPSPSRGTRPLGSKGTGQLVVYGLSPVCLSRTASPSDAGRGQLTCGGTAHSEVGNTVSRGSLGAVAQQLGTRSSLPRHGRKLTSPDWTHPQKRAPDKDACHDHQVRGPVQADGQSRRPVPLGGIVIQPRLTMTRNLRAAVGTGLEGD